MTIIVNHKLKLITKNYTIIAKPKVVDYTKVGCKSCK